MNHVMSVSLCLSISQSVSLHAIARFQRDRFTWQFLLAVLLKCVGKIQFWLKSNTLNGGRNSLYENISRWLLLHYSEDSEVVMESKQRPSTLFISQQVVVYAKDDAIIPQF